MRRCYVIDMMLVMLVGFGVPMMAHATVPWTPVQIAEDYARSGAASQPPFAVSDHGRSSSLDDPAYFWHYVMLCDFLVSMQFTGAGPNHGGMIEGESPPDDGIIETDNTQEAIRIWSQYAVWTGDTATYGPNIRMAQGYCERFPAWDEGFGYYAVHNCGWGFEAEKIYRQAYGDTSWTWYADSCAWWVFTQPLPINPYSTDLGQLDPLAEGLGIGGMYPHAVYRQRSDWQNFCLNEARILRRWFESNPARLNANEVWALCGGTALWGVCVSLFTAYPDSGQMWLSEYAPELDIWQSTGTWNHSHNTWYCNAQYEVFNILQDSVYWQNAIFITDSLIGLDTDQDGGIPPGWTFPVTNDHSWVSSYMGWMGMERVINGMPGQDAAVIGFASPDINGPHLAGDSLTVAVHIANVGRIPISGRLTVTGYGYADSVEVALPTGLDTVLTLSDAWRVTDDVNLPELSPLTAEYDSPDDQVSDNDSVSALFDIRHGVSIFGSITDALEPLSHVPAVVDVYHEAYPDSVWTSFTAPENGDFASGPRPLLEGVNRIVVRPPVQYMTGTAQIDISWESSPAEVDFELGHTDLALVDDDINQTYETWYLSSLDSFPELNVRLWERNLAELGDVSGVPTIVWFCGDDSVTSLDPSDQATLQDYLSQGGNLILSGQNIPEDEAVTQFLSTVLQCSLRTPNTNIRRVSGSPGNPDMEGVELFLIGQNGANNAWHPSSLFALSGSAEILRYSTGNEELCGVAGESGQGKYVFLSFPLEAASGINGSTTRDQFLQRCFEWFGDSGAAAEPRVQLPMSFWLAQNYPNPFNPTTTIRFAAPFGTPVTLVIYNSLGQEVRRLYDGPGRNHEMTVSWDGRSSAGTDAASGVYICRLRGAQGQLTRSLQLLR